MASMTMMMMTTMQPYWLSCSHHYCTGFGQLIDSFWPMDGELMLAQCGSSAITATERLRKHEREKPTSKQQAAAKKKE